MGRVVCFFSILLALAGCSPMIEAEFSDIEIQRPDIQVGAAPSTGNSSVTFSFTFDSSKLGATTNVKAQSLMTAVKLRKLSLTAKSGVTDLSFIRTLHVLAYVPLSKSTSQASQQVEIADYERRVDETVGTVFSVPLPEPVDIMPLLRPSSTDQRKIAVVVNIGGQLPAKSWTTDVSMSLSVELKQ
jgi:hypothetical protein